MTLDFLRRWLARRWLVWLAAVAIVGVGISWVGFGLRCGLAASIPSIIGCALLLIPPMRSWLAIELAKQSASEGQRGEIICRLRRLHSEWRAAVSREMSLEARPGQPNYDAYQQALGATDALSCELDQITATVLARPASCWADVVVLAELAVANGIKGAPASGSIAPERARQVGHAVLEAVLKLGATRHSDRDTHA